VSNTGNMSKQNTVAQGNTVPQSTSPNNGKFNFNFEDAWKAENSTNTNTNNTNTNNTGNKTPPVQQNPVQKPVVVNPPPQVVIKK